MIEYLFLVSLLLILTLSGWYLTFWWTHRRILSTASRLPCPPTSPLLGNALLFSGGSASISQNIIRFSAQFKGLFCLWVGPLPVFVVSDPSDVQTVLNSSNTLEKDDVYVFLKPFLGNGLLTAPVSTWKKYRRLITPIFHPANVELFLPEFNDVSKRLTKELGCGRPIDPRERLFSASADAVMRTVISRQSLEWNIKEKIHLLLDRVGSMLTHRLFKVYLHIDWVFHIIYRKELQIMMDAISACLVTFDQEWKDETNKRQLRKELENSENYDCVSRNNIIDVAWRNPQQVAEDHAWSDEIFTLMAGATDTIISAVSFLLVTLANHPEAQDRIRSEIRDALGDSSRDVTLYDLEAMQYLGCALLEAMRLHGSIPVILRKATKDTKLNKSSSNTVLPAGSRILVALQAMGWDSSRFPEPDKFMPERFLNVSERNTHTFLPFSAGPRGCPGKSYAMLFMKTMVVHLVRNYKISSPVKMDAIEYDLKFVMFSKTSLPVLFEPINK